MYICIKCIYIYILHLSRDSWYYSSVSRYLGSQGIRGVVGEIQRQRLWGSETGDLRMRDLVISHIQVKRHNCSHGWDSEFMANLFATMHQRRHILYGKMFDSLYTYINIYKLLNSKSQADAIKILFVLFIIAKLWIFSLHASNWGCAYKFINKNHVARSSSIFWQFFYYK